MWQGKSLRKSWLETHRIGPLSRNRRSHSFTVPIIIVSGRRLIAGWIRISDAIPIDFGEAHMAINKAQYILRVWIGSIHQRVPGASEKCRDFASQYSFRRT